MVSEEIKDLGRGLHEQPILIGDTKGPKHNQVSGNIPLWGTLLVLSVISNLQMINDVGREMYILKNESGVKSFFS